MRYSNKIQDMLFLNIKQHLHNTLLFKIMISLLWEILIKLYVYRFKIQKTFS